MSGRSGWAFLLCATLSLIFAATALAGGVQSTDPDACQVLRHSDVAPYLGAKVQSHPTKFDLPELPEADQDMNHFLDVSRTQCTWAAPTKSTSPKDLEFVTLNVYERNPDYSGGGKPWTVDQGIIELVALGSAKGFINVDNGWLAKHYKNPRLDTESLFVVTDRKTHGKRRAYLGYELSQDLWIVLGAQTSKQSAIDFLIGATKHIVAG
jgi:hypothetical protein